ncbi:ABC transporter ATP-binding protein [Planococcus antarcticus DSM 14505]|uniref:ABC transporter ATP-binding protein n=1 Tax=Planococcus antarcticus DSM 14505 TaxID=1185653 RepID=A0A1C7DBT6_9BACL|nr:ABC transporter ATP-binding protein [Planococcus antarcticus]ANU08959.1 bacitracin ABC transporter ATP-binding protein [Planococcus antarcticus DSM 14505]EIM06571.1 ABC transporter ATP-binding protein [Planococcus antarcticus DSM 14505]
MSEQALVQIKNLSKTIGKKKIIKNLNLDLHKGQITGFLGPNGAGKTTTIRMMVGLMKPTEGDVLIDGQSVKHHFEESIEKVGVIVENPEMYKYMSGYKNLLHFSRMHKGISKERIDEVVKQVGMQKRIKEKVGSYSLGMRQRLGLAQALLHDPKFLILDEPTNGLDPSGIREFRIYLQKIAQENDVAIFVSSHLLSEIELLCDRIAIIQNGELIDIKSVNELQQSRYYIQAEPLEIVGEVLTGAGFPAVLHDKGYLIDSGAEHIPGAINLLVGADVRIFAVQPYRETLESQFLEMTGGGEIAQAHTE